MSNWWIFFHPFKSQTGAHALASGALYFFKDVPQIFRWIFDFVYLKHSVNASATVVLGFDRAKFQCSDLYCHFQSPGKFLQSIGLKEDLSKNFTNMFVTLLVVHCFSFIVMRYRIKNWYCLFMEIIMLRNKFINFLIFDLFCRIFSFFSLRVNFKSFQF